MARTKVMGVLNVTPDSFSDGGAFQDVPVAISHALELVSAGADIIDVGGESTRPGAQPVEEATEINRVIPVVAALADRGVTVSVDTTKAGVAAAAITAGASIVNDVSGGLADPEMAEVIADHKDVRYIVGHWRGNPRVMDQHAQYEDVTKEVTAELAARVAALLLQGVESRQLIVDPCLGFAKAGNHNWSILAHLNTLAALGYPLLIGASRKRFLGEVAEDVDAATVAITTQAALAGVWAVRVHDVAANRAAVNVAAKLRSFMDEKEHS